MGRCLAGPVAHLHPLLAQFGDVALEAADPIEELADDLVELSHGVFEKGRLDLHRLHPSGVHAVSGRGLVAVHRASSDAGPAGYRGLPHEAGAGTLGCQTSSTQVARRGPAGHGAPPPGGRMRTTLALGILIAVTACDTKQVPTEAPAEPAPAAEAERVAALGESVATTMNPEADPCVDFYEYACGGWVANTELPGDKTRLVRSFTTITDQNQELLKTILEEAAADPGDDPDLKKVGAFYGACMDIEAIEAAGLGPVMPRLDAIAAAEDLKALWEQTGELHLEGASPFYSGQVSPDYKAPDENLLELGQGGLGLPDRAYYLEERNAKTLAAYQQHIARMLALAGERDADAARLAEAVVAFETDLAENSLPREELRDAEKTYHPKDRKGLQALTPNLSWKAHFAAMGYGGLDRFNVGTPGFFEALDRLLVETPVETVQAYLRYHLLADAAPYLSSEADQAHFDFYGTTLRGQKAQRPRWKRCVSRTESALGEVLGRIYVERAFPGDSKAIAVDMIERIEAEFEGGMDELDWMDDPTRQVAVEKSQAITNKIGYPDTWRDYSDLTVDPAKHFANVLAANTHASRFWLDQADKPVDPSLWYMTPQQVNAYYNPLANEIAFPAGIMQPPFFDRDFPMAMNYGAMGMVMAHEVSHGFDDSGRKFSPTGELTEWWAPEVAERFEERAACLEAQYSGYEVQPDLFVNGKLTLGENIADLGGIKQSHRAYTRWREQNGAEPEIAGLTNDQLFFVAYAQAWCSVQTPESEAERVQRDPHSPPRFRVNGPVRNVRVFGEAFGCEVGQPLYPEEDDICVIW